MNDPHLKAVLRSVADLPTMRALKVLEVCAEILTASWQDGAGLAIDPQLLKEEAADRAGEDPRIPRAVAEIAEVEPDGAAAVALCHEARAKLLDVFGKSKSIQ